MTPKSFLALAAITVFAVAVAAMTIMSNRVGNAVAERGGSLLPDLITNANTIARMTVRDGSETTTIERKDSKFIDASGFPIKQEVARDLVASLSLLRIEERKTADPKRYAELDLADPGTDQGSGKAVKLEDKNGHEVANVIIGRTDHTVGGISGGQFVRAVGNNQSYLVRGSVKLPYNRPGWFDTKLFDAGKNRIEKATLTDSKGARIEFALAEDKLNLTNLPEDKTADDAKLDRLLRAMKSIDFENVRKSSESNGTIRARLTFETQNGLSITIGAVEPAAGSSDDVNEDWVRITARSLKDEAKSELEKLNAKFKGYEFKLNSSDNEVLGWTMKDLLTQPSQS